MWPIWKTIKLTEKGDEYFKRLRAAGIKVSFPARTLIEDRIDFDEYLEDEAREEVSLVKVPVREITKELAGPLSKRIQIKDILSLASWGGLGLGFCPRKVGPALRLEYLNQPKGETLTIVMRTLKDRHGFPSMFRLSNNYYGSNKLELHTLDNPLITVFPEEMLVFCEKQSEWQI